MKKVLYIEIDEEVTSIYDQIRRVKQKDIFLVIPRKSVLFQSVINLRILKSKAQKAKKNLHLVTTDRVGRHLALKAGIPVYENLKIEEVKTTKSKQTKTNIEPIQARRNEVLKDLPKRVIQKKTTIGELIRDFRDDHKNKKGSTQISGVYHYIRPNRRFLGFVLALSLGLFFLIAYVALPGATVYVRPKFDNIEHAINITLADREKNEELLSRNEPNVIASEQIVTVTKQTKTFNTTSSQFDGTNARGQITIINTSADRWPLKNQTRFQTEEGIVFRIQEGVYVPPQTVDENEEEVPGTLTVEVMADPFDIYDKTVGDRGNIGPSKFTIPGLSAYNQERIWAESSESMTGGVSHYQKIVQAEDIEAAKRQIEDNLVLMAKDDLNTRLAEMNELNDTNLVLLDSGPYLTVNLQELRISEDLEGSLQDQFEIFAQVEAKGVAYDFDQLFDLLKKHLKNRVHPDMQLRDSSIKPESITFEPLSAEYNEETGQIKVTASIRGIQEYVIDSSLEAGVRFANKVKESIVGMTAEDAEGYVLSLPEVEEAKIKLWPIWLSKVPHIADNIQVKLLED